MCILGGSLLSFELKLLNQPTIVYCKGSVLGISFTKRFSSPAHPTKVSSLVAYIANTLTYCAHNSSTISYQQQSINVVSVDIYCSIFGMIGLGRRLVNPGMRLLIRFGVCTLRTGLALHFILQSSIVGR